MDLYLCPTTTIVYHSHRYNINNNINNESQYRYSSRRKENPVATDGIVGGSCAPRAATVTIISTATATATNAVPEVS